MQTGGYTSHNIGKQTDITLNRKYSVRISGDLNVSLSKYIILYILCHKCILRTSNMMFGKYNLKRSYDTRNALKFIQSAFMSYNIQ